jgi:ribonuclease HI
MVYHETMEKITVYAAGGALGNPGSAAVGVYITDATNTIVEEIAQAIGNGTSDFAAYYSVMLALQTLEHMYGLKTKVLTVELSLDNEFVKEQLLGERAIKEPGLVPMFIEIHNLRIESFPQLTIQRITETENKEATRLVRQVLDRK